MKVKIAFENGNEFIRADFVKKNGRNLYYGRVSKFFPIKEQILWIVDRIKFDSKGQDISFLIK